MTRKRSRASILGTVYFLALAGLALGASLWFDRRGERVMATVQDKREEITVSQVPQGWWYRWYRVDVEFPTRDLGPMRSTVSVPRARYDSLRPGDRLEIRYLPFFPLLARTSDRSTATVVWDLASGLVADPSVWRLLLWLAGGVIGLWIASRIGTPVVVVVGLLWVAAAFPLLFRGSGPPAPSASSSAETMGRVEGVSLVTKAPARHGGRRSRLPRGSSIRRLAVPYQVVQVSFAVPGRPHSVLAVDAVDSGSVRVLELGATLPIRYDTRNPRLARLSQGARTFVERNRYHYLVPILGVGAVGVLFAWGARSRRTKKAPDRA
jgi:hypothetical protein